VVMVPDWETNKVFYSFLSTYDFKIELGKLRRFLKESNLGYGHIAGTKDYFCRDYMPIQISENEYIQFNFKPDYLLRNEKMLGFVTDTETVFRKNSFFKKFKIQKSELILDGGNIIKSKNRVIVTDKVVQDNNLPLEEIREKLEKLFNAKVIIIPKFPGEETGHADGIIRFIDEETVLTINLDDENAEWKDKLIKELKLSNLNIISLPKAKSPDKDWRYINYLHVATKVIVPSFENDSDKIILPFLHALFEKYGIKMTTINAVNIAEQGGILNCFTWNIFEQ